MRLKSMSRNVPPSCATAWLGVTALSAVPYFQVPVKVTSTTSPAVRSTRLPLTSFLPVILKRTTPPLSETLVSVALATDRSLASIVVASSEFIVPNGTSITRSAPLVCSVAWRAAISGAVFPAASVKFRLPPMNCSVGVAEPAAVKK